MCQIIGHLISDQSLFDIQREMDKIPVGCGKILKPFYQFLVDQEEKKTNDMQKLNNTSNIKNMSTLS